MLMKKTKETIIKKWQLLYILCFSQVTRVAYIVPIHAYNLNVIADGFKALMLNTVNRIIFN